MERYRFPRQDSRSVLLVTLDSCRYDTFLRAEVANMKAVGPLYRAQAPGNFTYSSHMAIFMGFTPGDPQALETGVNPKFGKIFRMAQGGIAGRGGEHFLLEGRNIVEGFKRKGYLTLGSGAVGWFNPQTETARVLIDDFHHFHYAGNCWSLGRQLAWLAERLAGERRPSFTFLNLGETHVPYYYDGAPWSPEENPCVPFSPDNDAAEAARRQLRALEWVDGELGGLLEAFADATVVICADHGDCWGEDGLWEHGFSHEKVLEVPLLFRLGER